DRQICGAAEPLGDGEHPFVDIDWSKALHGISTAVEHQQLIGNFLQALQSFERRRVGPSSADIVDGLRFQNGSYGGNGTPQLVARVTHKLLLTLKARLETVKKQIHSDNQPLEFVPGSGVLNPLTSCESGDAGNRDASGFDGLHRSSDNEPNDGAKRQPESWCADGQLGHQ